MTQIFISYSRKDYAIAERIVNALTKNDLVPWIDWQSIPKGEEFDPEIQRGLEASDIFLFLISPRSIHSNWCKKEIDYAVANGKRILPVMIDDTDAGSIPPEIAKYNWIYCRDLKDDFATAIEQIDRTIHTDFEWLKYHNKLQNRALDWQRSQDASHLLQGRALLDAEQWLARVGKGKDPQPTELQRELVVASRTAVTSRRNSQVKTGVGILVALCFLCTVAGFGLVLAYVQSKSAAQKEVARATAQNLANEQQDLALSRRLAITAQNLDEQTYESLTVRTLLSIEALHKSPNNSLAIENLHGLPLAKRINSIAADVQTDEAVSILDSTFAIQGGNALAMGYHQNTSSNLIIWDLMTGDYVYEWQCRDRVASATFNQRGDWAAIVCKAESLVIINIPEYKSLVLPSPDGRVFGLDTQAESIRVFVDSSEGLDYSIEPVTNQAVVLQSSQGASYLQISHDGSMVAGMDGSNHQNIYVWEAKTGQLRWQLAAKERFHNFSISDDNRFLIAAGDNAISIWGLDDGDLRNRLDLDTTWYVNDIKMSPDNSMIGIASSSGLGSVLDAATGEQVWATVGHNIESISFSGDSKLVAVSNREGVIVVANLILSQLVATLPGNAASEGGLQFSDNAGYLLVDEYTRSSLWDLSVLGQTASRVIPGRVIAGGNSVAVVSSENYVHIYDLNDTDFVSHNIDLGIAPSVIDVNLDADRLAITGSDGRLHYRVLNNGKQLETIENLGDIYALRISQSGKYIAIAVRPNQVHIWDADARTIVAQIDLDPQAYVNASSGLVFSPDETRLVINAYTVYTVEVPSGRQLFTLQPIDFVSSNIEFSPDGLMLAFSTKNGFNNSGTTCIYNAMTGQEQFCNGYAFATNILFSADGKYLLQDSYDKEILMWNTDDGLILQKFENLTGPMIRGANSTVVVSSYNTPLDTTSIVLLDLEQRVETLRITKNSNVQTIGFSEDFQRMIVVETMMEAPTLSAHSVQLLEAWLWKPEDMVAEACARVTRNLTREEWQQHVGTEVPYRAVCSTYPIESDSIP